MQASMLSQASVMAYVADRTRVVIARWRYR